MTALPENTRDVSVYPTDKSPHYHPLWGSTAYHEFYEMIRGYVQPHEIYDLWYDLLWKTLNLKTSFNTKSGAQQRLTTVEVKATKWQFNTMRLYQDENGNYYIECDDTLYATSIPANSLDACQYDDENAITDYKVTTTKYNLITGEPSE